jgi:uncharacterized membrane protein YfcA
MRALLASPLGFLIGVSLGALGGGGSILAVPVLVYAAGQDAKEATATSLLLVGSAALVGMAAHQRAGRVRVATGIGFGLAGVGGSLAGTALNRRLDPDALLLGFSILVFVAAWRMVAGCPTCTQVGEQRVLAATHMAGPVRVRAAVRPRTVVTVLLAGTGVGFLTGLFGVGGGFVIVPALTLVLGLSMPDAIGTSLLVIAINAAVALAGRTGASTIDWGVAVPFTVSAVLGVLVGKRVADRLDARRSLNWFAVLLVGVALYTAIQAGATLLM